jgi:hypothetical protein
MAHDPMASPNSKQQHQRRSKKAAVAVVALVVGSGGTACQLPAATQWGVGGGGSWVVDWKYSQNTEWGARARARGLGLGRETWGSGQWGAGTESNYKLQKPTAVRGSPSAV